MFTVAVTQVNQPPTFTLTNVNPQILENAGQQTVQLTNISPGFGDAGQTVTISATSSNPGLIPNPMVIFPPNNTTAMLTFTPVPFTFGAATITVSVTNSGIGAGTQLTTTQTFTVAVLHVNQAPTLNPIPNPATLLQNATLQTVSLSGISAGQGDNGQTLTITATSSNTNLIPNPIAVTYPNINSTTGTVDTTTGSLSFTPVPNANGTAMITVTVMDNGTVTNGGVATIQQTFFVTVAAVNQAPTLNTIPNPAPILENAGQQTVPLSGISDGDNGTQTVTISAAVTNTTGTLAISGPAVSFADSHQANESGSLTFTPVANTFGTATITVTVIDNGGNANGGINTVFQTFTVTVLPVNQPPTLAPIVDPANPTTAAATINSTGGVSGITVTNGGSGYVSAPTVTITGGGGSGATATAALNSSGVVTGITVTSAGTGYISTPTVAIANNFPILENAGQQTINLAGILNGVGDPSSTLSITATSNNTALIPDPKVTYTSPNTTGTLTFTPTAGASGTATITVTLSNGGSTANGGASSTIQTFIVTVSHVNLPPTLAPITNPSNASNPNNFTILENSTTPQTASLTGIADGVGDVGQSLTVTASSSNTSVIPTPTVTYTSPSQTGSVSFAPAHNAVGTATITVTVTDGGVGNNSVSQTFTVTITPVNQPPSFTSTIAVTNGGSGYSSTSPPTVTIGAPASGGTQETGKLASVNSAGVVTGITITNPGSGYTSGLRRHDRRPAAAALQATATSNPPAVNEGSGSQTVLNFALFNPGAPNEASQTAAYIITTVSNPNLFDVNPAISSTGTLTYTPAPNTIGTSTFTVEVMDSGGTTNGGVDLSAPETFTITVNGVNQAPSFVKGPNETVPENSGEQTLAAWATNISPGPAQPARRARRSTSWFRTTTPRLFSVQPAISPDGTLTYTPAPGTSGTATVTVDLQNSGSTANGGVNTSASQIFTITVSPVIATPQVVPMAPVSFIQGGTAGNVVVAMFSEVNGGPASDFSATINWGDGTAPTAGIVTQDSVATATAPATYSVLGSHVYASSGAFTITVAIVDHNGGSPVSASNIAVANSSASLLSAAAQCGERLRPSNSVDGVTNVTSPDHHRDNPCRALADPGRSGPRPGPHGLSPPVPPGPDGSFQLTSSAAADGTTTTLSLRAFRPRKARRRRQSPSDRWSSTRWLRGSPVSRSTRRPGRS